MLSIPGRYIGDSWYYVNDSVAHCYFLTSPESIHPDDRWFHWEIGHAVSDDLINWKYVGLALEKGTNSDWDSQNLATGSVIKRAGLYWMAYTAQRIGEEPKIWRIGMAVSDNLYDWTKLRENPVTEPDEMVYEWISSGTRKRGNWNDPFMYEFGGPVYQFFCARKKSDDPNARGTIGLAVSNDMITWDIKNPIEVDPVAEELEVPQIYEFNGLYYLVFCTVPFLLLKDFKEKFPEHDFYSADFSMVSSSPFGPFRMHGTGEIVPKSAPEIPYASQLIQWEGNWFLIGTVKWNDAKGESSRYICDPIPISVDETGIHAVV